MAQEALKKLEEELNCSICLDTYTDPKLLQCFHVYCQQCLVPLVDQDQQSLTCPICRQVTPIPGRVADLQSAFNINRFLRVRESLQRDVNPAVTLEGAVGGATMNAPSSDVARHCFEHPEEELKLYCETCGELVCMQCIMKDAKHHDHDYALLKKAFKKFKDEITPFLEPMEKQVTTLTKALAKLDTRCGEISDQLPATKDNVHVTFKRLREALTVRETELIGRLDQLAVGKLKGLAAQRDQIETSLAQLTSCLHFMRESFKTGEDLDVLMMKTNTVNQAKELTTPFQPDFLKPNTAADIVFSASADMTAACESHGQVIAPGSPDPSKCHVTGEGVAVVGVGEKSTAILQAISFEGTPCEEPIKSLECELASEITGTRRSCSVERRGQSQYEISYQPTIKGRHQLHIKAEGQHVRGSPFSISVKSSVEKLGAPILTIGAVKSPWGVAINRRGEVVVSEFRGQCVSVFSSSGEKLRSFGSGSGQGRFQNPNGTAVDGEGNILVVDYENYRIQKFTAEGQFLTAVGTEGSGPLQFSHPRGIAFNASNDMVYVVDSGNHRVQVLNSDLTFSSTFGKAGGQFASPMGIACDSTGTVYVADYGNHRIQVFTAEGEFLRTFGSRGQGRGELNSPFGVAVDTSGMVYVSEFDNHRVSVFTSEGQCVTSFGRQGGGPGEFIHPCGLAVDDSGVVYVCDGLNNCVQVL